MYKSEGKSGGPAICARGASPAPLKRTGRRTTQSSEEVHDKIPHIVCCALDPVHGGLCAARDGLARVGGHVAKVGHGGIPTLLRDVLAEEGTANGQAAHDERAAADCGHLGAGAPLLLLLLVLGLHRLVLGRDLRRGQGRGLSGGDRHEHRLAHFGRRRDVDGDELLLVLGVGDLDGGAGGARRHSDAEGRPSRRDGLLRRLPLVGRSDLTLLSTLRVLLRHLPEVNFVRLLAQAVPGLRVACQVRTLQDLVFVLVVVLPLPAELHLEHARRHGCERSA
mmetsp:Transcript_26449/g.53642  ORF Transcript_26449/g.53642 Transcript_26449/m.53642 type:complete len:279 (+) Transcript_26449:125-961(+)